MHIRTRSADGPRAWRSRAIALVASLLMALSVVAPAQAEDAMPLPLTESTVEATTITIPGTTSTSSVITCTINAQHPHDSSHVGGTVNGVATISCSQAVSSLSITVELWYQDAAVVAGPTSKSNFGRAFIKHNAATTCVPGYYRTVATGRVVFPPGYVPPSGTVGHYSPLIFVDCA